MAVVVLLSPAKTLCWDPAPDSLPVSSPLLLQRSDAVATTLKSLSPGALKSLLGVNPQLAELNHERYRSFQLSGTVAAKESDLRPAAFAYDGPAFQGLEARTLSREDLDFAQRSLCILTALYGVVRPLDLIQPYRLEMSMKLQVNGETRAMHDFWRPDVTAQIQAMLKEQAAGAGAGAEPPTVINVASQEYSKAVDFGALRAAGVRVVDCTFHDDGRVVSVLAKRSRGLMARHAIQCHATTLAAIRAFNSEGYTCSTQDSREPDTLVFARTKQARLAAAPATQRGGAKKPKPTASAAAAGAAGPVKGRRGKAGGSGGDGGEEKDIPASGRRGKAGGGGEEEEKAVRRVARGKRSEGGGAEEGGKTARPARKRAKA